MFLNNYTYRLVLCFALLFAFQSSYAQSESQLLKKSNSSFSKEDYKNAVQGFRQLLSNDIKNIDYNYKYAVCLFYTKNPKSSQKYFDYLLNQEGFPIDVFYFKGRLYHLNYQFQQAIEMYEDYEKMRSNKDKDYHCLQEIKRCQNALSLLKSPRAIEVISMEKMSADDYFSSYVFDAENYKLYSVTDVFTKINQKNNFVPKYVFKRGMKYRFFSSYSKLENSQKDLFIQKKGSDNEWQEPVRLSIEINSSFNEDFPFYDESNGFLYFSSDGHSSIGGMDVFRIRLNLKNLTFGTIENLNFPYSSTYDDFLYIPVASSEYAYFSTNRNSDIGSLEVVKSKISNKEVPSFVSRLIFHDEINEQITSAQFYLTNRNSQEKFGPFNTNDSGSVHFLIPAPGIYELSASIEGSDLEFNEDVNFPPKVDGYDYQVMCTYKLLDSKEVLLLDEQLTDQSAVLAEVNQIDFQEFSKLIVNSESIKANEEIEVQEEIVVLSKEEIDAKIDEFYDIEAEIEDQKRQKKQVSRNLIEAKQNLASIDQNIERIKAEINSYEADNKDLLRRELRDTYVKRKALIENFDKQTELYNKFQSNEELDRSYQEISAINKSISENNYKGQTDSVNQLIANYEPPQHFEPMIPSIPDIAREKQNQLEEDFKSKVEIIEEIEAEIVRESKELENLKEKLSDVKTIENWNTISDSISIVEIKLAEKTKKKGNLELERESLSEQIIFAEESLLNLTLIETDVSDEDTLNETDLAITEEEKTKFYADEVFINKEIEQQEELSNITNERKNEMVQISSTDLPEAIKDSLVLISESSFIERVNIHVDENLSQSNEKLNELIQVSQNNIEEIIENNENLTSVLTNKNTEEVSLNEPESGVEEVTEELSTETIAENTETRGEETSAETNTTRSEGSTEEVPLNEPKSGTEEVTEDLSTEAIAENTEIEPSSLTDNILEENSKSVEYLTSLVLEENMGSQSTDKSNEFDEASDNEENLREYFQKELDIAIANEKIENKYVKIKRQYSSVKFEGKSNIEAQLRELDFKERDLKMKLEKTSSPSVKLLIAKLIDANGRKKDLLKLELEELNVLAQEELNIQALQIEAKRTIDIQKSNSYYNYVLDRDEIEKEHELLEDLIFENERIMLNLDESLRENINTTTLSAEQKVKIQNLAEIQEAISYLKESIIERKEKLAKVEDSQSFEYLYKRKINPEVYVSNENIINNTVKINKVTSEIGLELESTNEKIDNVLTDSESFERYSQKRALLNLKIEELGQIENESFSDSESSIPEPQKEAVIYINERKKERISKDILSLMNEMKSIDSSAVYEGYINNSISNNNLASNSRINQSILEVYQPVNSDRNSFTVLEKEIVDQNKETLPIFESNPSGLNFRVQVGAFRRPVRDDVYREFTPVSGQQLSNGLIVYMAGYFNNSKDAINAQKSIRSIGYSDAFVVSYCNDERLPFWKGKDHERNGTCLASNRNELIAINSGEPELSNDSESSNNSELLNNSSIAEVNNNDANNLNVTNTASEEFVKQVIKEQHGTQEVSGVKVSGLFYSVQVGAFNRKIRSGELDQLQELNYYLSSGLYRYSSGKFTSIDKARERQKEVVSLGISDAFIVAFYNGERISIGKSRNLLTEKGDDILYEENSRDVSRIISQTDEVIKGSNIRTSNTSGEPVMTRIQIPIINSEKEPEKDELVLYQLKSDSFDEGTIERLNRIAVFNYDQENSLIKSVVIKKDEITPIMSFYMKGMEEKTFEPDVFIEYKLEVGNQISGKLANWLLRSNKTFSFIVLNGVNHVVFYLNNELERMDLRDELDELLK